jgi:uncharacterized membrane protein YhaH (DUF805 family)
MDNRVKITFDEFIRRLYLGRIDRRTWVTGCLAWFAIFGLLIPQLFVRILPENAVPMVLGALFLLAFVLIFSLHVRRLHDVNMSGWFSLLLIVPVVNLFLLVILFRKGEKTANKYGDLMTGEGLKAIFNQSRWEESKVELSGYLFTTLSSFVIVYGLLWLLRSIWVPSIAGLIGALYFDRRMTKSGGPNRTLLFIVAYIVCLFLFMLFLTALENEYRVGCSNAPLSCSSLRFFQNLLKY